MSDERAERVVGRDIGGWSAYDDDLWKFLSDISRERGMDPHSFSPFGDYHTGQDNAGYDQAEWWALLCMAGAELRFDAPEVSVVWRGETGALIERCREILREYEVWHS